MYKENYPVPNAKCLEVPCSTLSERLQQERQNLAARLAEIDASLSALNANPQVKEVLDVLQKTRCL